MVVALGLVIWVIRLLVADPKGVVKKMFAGSKNAADAEIEKE